MPSKSRKTYCQLVQEGCEESAEIPAVPPKFRAVFREAARTISVLRDALEEYACPGRGACPAPWNNGECSLGDRCGTLAESALCYDPDERS